jgi:hypothetical protein
MPTPMSSPNPHLNITTHSGQLQQPWRKMCMAKRQNTHATPTGPHPLHSNLQLTMHSWVLMPKGFDLQTPPRPSHAHAVPPSAPHNTSPGSAHYSFSPVPTTPFTLMGALSHTPPSTTHTHTNSFPSSETAMPHCILLSLAPQGKYPQNLTEKSEAGSRSVLAFLINQTDFCFISLALTCFDLIWACRNGCPYLLIFSILMFSIFLMLGHLSIFSQM